MSEILVAAAAVLALIFAPRVVPDAVAGWRRAAAIAGLRLVFGASRAV